MSDGYSKNYIAAKDIEVNGVAAFHATHPVPDSHVDNGIVSRDDVVVRNPSGPTVAELRAQLEALGLPTDGKKDELIARLAEHPNN